MCVIDMTRAKNPISVITAFLRLTILVVGKQKKSFNWEGGFSRKALTGDSVVVVVFWSVVVFLVAVFLVVFFFSRRSTQSSEAMMMMMMMVHERDVLEGLGFRSLCKIFRVLTVLIVVCLLREDNN